MRANLKAEMVRKGIHVLDIVRLLDVSEKTARNKIDDTTKFNIDEALKIRQRFFPELCLEYLFASDSDTRDSA